MAFKMTEEDFTKFESKVKERKTGITKKESKKYRQSISREGTEEKKKK